MNFGIAEWLDLTHRQLIGIILLGFILLLSYQYRLARKEAGVTEEEEEEEARKALKRIGLSVIALVVMAVFVVIVENFDLLHRLVFFVLSICLN